MFQEFNFKFCGVKNVTNFQSKFSNSDFHLFLHVFILGLFPLFWSWIVSQSMFFCFTYCVLLIFQQLLSSLCWFCMNLWRKKTAYVHIFSGFSSCLGVLSLIYILEVNWTFLIFWMIICYVKAEITVKS